MRETESRPAAKPAGASHADGEDGVERRHAVVAGLSV